MFPLLHRRCTSEKTTAAQVGREEATRAGKTLPRVRAMAGTAANGCIMSGWCRGTSALTVALALVGCTGSRQSSPATPPATDDRVLVALLDGPVADLPAFDCVRLSQGTDARIGSSHGTRVASVITGVAEGRCPSSRLVLEVFDIEEDGRAVAALIAPAIGAAVAHGADVVHISAALGDDHPSVRHAIADAVAGKVIVVAAAGNSAGLPAGYPAAYPGVLSVGSLAHPGELSVFSARRGVTVAAIGEAVPALETDGSVAESTGTSFAAARVTADAAAHLLRGTAPGRTLRLLTDEYTLGRTRECAHPPC